EAKFTEMIKRRLRNGQYFHKPYLGVREFPAEIRLIENGKDAPAPIPDSRALGLMLYDILYIKNEHNVVREFCPTFFMAEMENGSINLRNTEVLR
ncbi:MAG: type I-E CRISPR-associated protein Cas5/CasD, partial [Eubacteriales bacterium]|nr:type I-E CRISPR-associated protein Cas5/CasD [Eubacteriales bacterium]